MNDPDNFAYDLVSLVPQAVVDDLLSLGLHGEWPIDHRPTFADLLSLRKTVRPDYRDEYPVVDDATLSSLRFTPHVIGLDLGSTHVTDAGMEHLRFLPQLESLDVTNSRVGDDGICRLLGHRRLNRVTAMESRVTILGERMLRAFIPGCDVSIGRLVGRGRVRSFDGAMFVVSPIHDDARLFYVELRDCNSKSVDELVRDPIGRLVSFLVGKAGEPDLIRHVLQRGDEIAAE